MDQVLLAWAKAKGTVPVTLVELTPLHLSMTAYTSSKMSTQKKRLEGYINAGEIRKHLTAH